MSIISVKNITKAYGDFVAVDSISFDIEKGEVFGFLGPNGAGKTSTINMLIGLSRPTSGSINILGSDGIKDIKKLQRIIGVVPDESNLYAEMSGFDNLCFCAALYGINKRTREQRAKELLELFNLKSAGDRPFRAYSKGMRRRLTIAAGIIHNPKILFLDEPTTGIDVESARHIRSLILELKQKGITTFLTTHYIEEAQRICDRIAFIVNGKIVKIGAVQELMQSAEKEQIITLTLSDDVSGVLDDFSKKFPDLVIKSKEPNIFLISSSKKVSLLPIIQFFDSCGYSVYEANKIRPSLEDVFVRITGIESNRPTKEKGEKKSGPLLHFGIF